MRPGGRNIYSIDGFVRDEQNPRPVENVRVELRQSGGTPMGSAFTRGNGEFEFDGLPSGDYTIEINLRDYEPVRQSVTISSTSVRGLSIFLTRPVKMGSPVMGATISAHQLSVPHKARDEFEKGMMLSYGKSEYRAAIEQFQKAIKDFPTYYEAYSEEGEAYYRLGEMGPAEEALRKSIDLSSGQYADACFILAGLLTDGNRYKDAANMARKGMSVDNSSWLGPFELARALNGLKQPEEAEKNATRSRDIMPDNPAVYLLLANIHIQRRDLNALVKDIDDYLRLAPNGPDADRARKTRESAKAMLNAQAENSAANKQEKQQSGGNEAHPDSPQSASPPEPDNSGLSPLPPPSPGNQ
jgi:Tfp pilus assembly protein PilF